LRDREASDGRMPPERIMEGTTRGEVQQTLGNATAAQGEGEWEIVTSEATKEVQALASWRVIVGDE
jgi:hypothetical protein